MLTYDTPDPITVSIDLGVGDVRITASDRTDTTVEVRPSDPSKEGDATAARQTRVEYARGRLLIKTPRRRQYSVFGGRESVDIDIFLPAGSHVHGEAGLAALHGAGQLGDVRYKTGAGGINLDRVRSAHLRTGAGDVTVDVVAGQPGEQVDVSTGSGVVRIGQLTGIAEVKNSNGDTWIGQAAADLRVRTANGSITVATSTGSLELKTSRGDLRVGEVAAGTVSADTSFGAIGIGVPLGHSAWLDLDTKFGTVRNSLDETQRPDPGEQPITVRARTSFGDITIRRVGQETPTGADVPGPEMTG
jgi:DUF4097 and DUF4098 domain-containing protein YvlB